MNLPAFFRFIHFLDTSLPSFVQEIVQFLCDLLLFFFLQFAAHDGEIVQILQ